MKLVLATHNAHKVNELRSILGARLDGIELVGYDGPEPIEDEDTFAANALIKARAASAYSGLPAIADDSGIVVDALGGAPGIYSARYAGTRDDSDNREKLLADLAQLGDAVSRTARFECAAALVVPPRVGVVGVVGVVGADGTAESADSFEHVETASWAGTVLREAAGSGGFGYDPVFEPDGYAVSAAELSPDEKNAISHRAKAFGQLFGVVKEQLRG